MTQRHRLILLTLLISSICMGLQCDKDFIEYEYHFQETISISPESKSYRVGDTIWVEYTNPDKKFHDKKTGQRISVDTVSVDFQLSVNALYLNPIAGQTDGYCDFVMPTGLNSGRDIGVYGTGMLTEFGCGNANYNYKVGVVMKYSGYYSLHLPEDRIVYRCPASNSSFPLSKIGYQWNVADGNKDIYLSIPPNYRGESTKGLTEKKIDDQLVYIIQVK